MNTVLIIEDEPELVKVLRSYLENSGFEVLSAYRGDTGLSTWEHRQPDLVILDLNLPGMDGMEVARAIRGRSDTPILMLTARVGETDQVLGLEIAADDYVTKPYSPRVVVAKVRALLRRSQSANTARKTIRIAGFEIDLDGRTVALDGQNIELTPTEFMILATMAAQPGRAFSRAQLLDVGQDQGLEAYERTIDVHVKNLRAKVEDNPKEPAHIQTVYGLGYRFARSD
jgi:two-component system alkaline phosphatase synthesis response regulator PhoP